MQLLCQSVRVAEVVSVEAGEERSGAAVACREVQCGRQADPSGLHQVHPGVPGNPGPSDGCGVVAGVVIHDGGGPARLSLPVQRFQGGPEPGPDVADGDAQVNESGAGHGDGSH